MSVLVQATSHDRVTVYTLSNENGMTVSLTNYGATILSICVPDKHGQVDDVTLGYSTLDDYMTSNRDAYFGATVGRVANRIEGAEFILNGKTIKLNTVEGSSHCDHGGPEVCSLLFGAKPQGFSFLAWEFVSSQESADECNVTLQVRSPDGDQGFPGEVVVVASYTLTAQNSFNVKLVATTNAPTPVNLTVHPYFNLNTSLPLSTVNDHFLSIDADYFIPVNQDIIPLPGGPKSVEATLMDLRHPVQLGNILKGVDSDQQLIMAGGGFDQAFILNANYATDWRDRVAVVLAHNDSGRKLEIKTNQPVVQCYTSNCLSLLEGGKKDQQYYKHSGICLEAMRYPNAPNRSDYPPITLIPGEEYVHETWHRFYV